MDYFKFICILIALLHSTDAGNSNVNLTEISCTANKCFYSFNKNKTLSWQESQEICKDNDMTLISFNDDKEKNELQDILDTMARNYSAHEVWIDGRKVFDTHPIWLIDNTLFIGFINGIPTNQCFICILGDDNSREIYYDGCKYHNRFICEDPNNVYYVINTEVNWLDAFNHCHSNDMVLVRLPDGGFKDYHSFNGSQRVEIHTAYWIGLTHERWIWNNTGDLIPLSFNLPLHTTDGCVYMTTNTADELEVGDCTAKKHLLCQDIIDNFTSTPVSTERPEEFKISPSPKADNSKPSTKYIIIMAVLAVVILLFVVGTIVYCWFKRENNKKNTNPYDEHTYENSKNLSRLQK